eukprot:1184691-Amphidinium_carterae.1
MQLLNQDREPTWKMQEAEHLVLWTDAWTDPHEDDHMQQIANRRERRLIQQGCLSISDARSDGSWNFPVIEPDEEDADDGEDVEAAADIETWQPDEATQQARPTCKANQRPRPHIPAKISPTFAFNNIVAVDLFFLHSPFKQGDQIVFSAICWGTGFHAVQYITERTAETVFKAFASCWLQHFGTPRLLVADQGSEFSGFFSGALGQLGCLIHTTDSASPWQNGRIERAGQHLKRIIELT